MLRVRHLLHISSSKLAPKLSSNSTFINGIWPKSISSNSIRSYCKKTTDDGKVSSTLRKKGILSHPSPTLGTATVSSPSRLRECKPVDTISCQPLVPSIRDSPPKNLMSELPQTGGDGKESDQFNRKWLLMGLLVTAFTLGTLWYVAPITDKEETTKVSKQKKKRSVVKVPATSTEIPKNVPYLLIGGGTASFTTFRAIKSSDPKAKVLIISNEGFYPYMRPPLSKEVWFTDDKESIKKRIFKQWNGAERSLFYEPDDFYINCDALMESPNGGVAVARGWSVKKLDIGEKNAYLDDGSVIHYDKCLIATGAKPKLSSVFKVAMANEDIQELVKMYRDIYDFEEAHEMFENNKDIAIIGGGFLGSELACAMARKDKNHEKNIYQIFKETGNMRKILPEYLSFWTTERVKDEGVKVLAETEIVSIKIEKDKTPDSNKNKLVLGLNNGKSLTVDYAIVAIGAVPNTDLAEESGLEVDPELGGYLVNSELQARTDVFVAGDCACFYDTKLGRRRFEHHDHAVVTGRLAGENMTGARKPYLHQSMFWSDLGPDVGYEAIGIVDSNLPTVAVFSKDNPKSVAANEEIRSKTEEVSILDKNLKEVGNESDESKNKKVITEGEDYGKGVIFYLKNDIVVGIVLWNVFNRMGVARQVLMDHKKYDDLNEVAKLFTIHED